MLSPVFKTFLFLGALSALFIAIGYQLGGPDEAWFFFFISLAINLISYWFSDRIALRMSGAQPLPRNQAPELYTDIEDLCRQMNIPMPAVYYSSQYQANAFATGRNPHHSSICYTQGILQLLNRNELRAVTSHELSHVKNRDVLIATIAAVMASAISGLARVFMFGGAPRNRDRNGNPLGGLLMIVLAPIAALLIQLAISRQREFQADESGSRVTHHPEDLASALEKIERSVRSNPVNINPALSSLYIENPLKSGEFMAFFSTHPPTEERVQRLMNMRF